MIEYWSGHLNQISVVTQIVNEIKLCQGKKILPKQQKLTQLKINGVNQVLIVNDSDHSNQFQIIMKSLKIRSSLVNSIMLNESLFKV